MSFSFYLAVTYQKILTKEYLVEPDRIELYTHKNDNDNDIGDHDYIYFDENNNIRGSISSNVSNL